VSDSQQHLKKVNKLAFFIPRPLPAGRRNPNSAILQSAFPVNLKIVDKRFDFWYAKSQNDW